MSRIDQRWEKDPGSHAEEGGVLSPAEVDASDVPVPATESGMPPVPDAPRGDNRAARLPQDVEDKFTVR